MHARRGIFWQSLLLTLVLLLPMAGVTLFLQSQRQQQQELRQAAAQRGNVRIEAGAQSVWRILLVMQQEDPCFVLARIDGPQQTVTLCALPTELQVTAPAGTTTLGECALSAGAGRAAQLLQQTLLPDTDAAPALYYLAATPDTWQLCVADIGAVRLDTSALLTQRQQQALGYGEDPVTELTAATAGESIAALQSVRNTPAAKAEVHAAVWCAFLRQEPSLLNTVPDAWRQYSARTLTNLLSPELSGMQETLSYLAGQPGLQIDYTCLQTDTDTLTAEDHRVLRQMLA